MHVNLAKHKSVMNDLIYIRNCKLHDFWMYHCNKNYIFY